MLKKSNNFSIICITMPVNAMPVNRESAVLSSLFLGLFDLEDSDPSVFSGNWKLGTDCRKSNATELKNKIIK